MNNAINKALDHIGYTSGMFLNRKLYVISPYQVCLNQFFKNYIAISNNKK
jgi:hypothetical protein